MARHFMKVHTPLHTVLFATLLSAIPLSCRSEDPRGPAMGKDYFRQEFSCTHDLIHNESDAVFLLTYETYRKKFFKPQIITKDPFSVLLAGDSIAALFYPRLLEELLPEFSILNRGVPGDTTTLFYKRLKEDILAIRPSVLILTIGGNDLLGGRCISDAIHNTRAILDVVRSKLPSTDIILISIPPVLSWKANSISPFYNQKLEYMAKEDSRVHYLDLWQVLAHEERPVLKEEYHLTLPGGKTDTIHFNERGYAAWAELLRPLLLSIRKEKRDS